MAVTEVEMSVDYPTFIELHIISIQNYVCMYEVAFFKTLTSLI